MSVSVFHGWRVVAACFVVAAVGWSLGLFGSSVYLQAVTAAHGWPIAEVASAITVFFLVSASVQRIVGRSIDRHGPRPVLLVGTACMATGVALIGQVTTPWQLYPCFVLVGIGWSTLSTTGITTTVAPWFERHQGRSMTLAIMGASVGAIVGVPLLLLSVATLGLGGGLMAAGIVAAVILTPLVTIVLRHRGPADIGQQRDGGPVTAGEVPAPLAPPIATAANSRRLLWSTAIAFALGLTIQIGFITPHVPFAELLLCTAEAGRPGNGTGLPALGGRPTRARPALSRARAAP
ncbi:MAG: MFS transporter, partial [Reyranella sp.]|nr:MFS transporter [Reyranella sp.]